VYVRPPHDCQPGDRNQYRQQTEEPHGDMLPFTEVQRVQHPLNPLNI
jgi:hypothetical protein